MARTMHLLNSFGHLTVHWELQNNALVLPAIQQMLNEKYKFFILSGGNEVEVTNINELVDRRIILPDETLQRLYDSGLLKIGGVTIEDDAETTGAVATTPEEVLENDTIAIQPAQGG